MSTRDAPCNILRPTPWTDGEPNIYTHQQPLRPVPYRLSPVSTRDGIAPNKLASGHVHSGIKQVTRGSQPNDHLVPRPRPAEENAARLEPANVRPLGKRAHLRTVAVAGCRNRGTRHVIGPGNWQRCTPSPLQRHWTWSSTTNLCRANDLSK